MGNNNNPEAPTPVYLMLKLGKADSEKVRQFAANNIGLLDLLQGYQPIGQPSEHPPTGDRK